MVAALVLGLTVAADANPFHAHVQQPWRPSEFEFCHVAFAGLDLPNPQPRPQVVPPPLPPDRGVSPTLAVGLSAALLAALTVGLAVASGVESHQSFDATSASERRSHADTSRALAVGAYASGASAVAAGIATFTLRFWAP